MVATSYSVPLFVVLIHARCDTPSRVLLHRFPRTFRGSPGMVVEKSGRMYPRRSVSVPAGPVDDDAVSKMAETTGVGFGKAFGLEDRVVAKMFLADRRGDFEAAKSKLENAVNWRKQFGPVPIPRSIYAIEEEKSGKCFVHHSLDKAGRPVVVVNVKKHVIGEYPSSSSEALCVAMMEKAIDKLDDPEGQISLVFNLRGFGLQNADFSFVKFMIKVLYKYYPQRLGVAYMVDAPFIFKGPWKVVKPWLRRYAQLVEFVKSKDFPDVFVDPAEAPKLLS